MRVAKPEVWEVEYAIETTAPAAAIWALFSDVAGWKRWNAGVESVVLQGRFAAGNSFVMTTPGGERFTTRLVEVTENVGFLDETCIGDLRIFVDHRIEVQGNGRTRVRYCLEVFGPGGEEVGRAVSADFPDVLKALVQHAECMECETA